MLQGTHTFVHSEGDANFQIDSLHEWIKLWILKETACGCINLSS